MRSVISFLSRAGRLVSLVLFAALGASVLMRYSPGYLADTRELDAAHAGQARSELKLLQADQANWPVLLAHQCTAWLHGDLGRSRHYDVPVADLIKERSLPSLRLLVSGVVVGWGLALAFAVPLSLRKQRRANLLVSITVAALLAVPVGVLATFSLLLNSGGPVLTLALLVAVREFKLIHGLMAAAWRAPHTLHSRAQGFSTLQSLRVHLLSRLRPELLNLFGMSTIIALSALVPVEVTFAVPGLGQLAWASAINRDLPVLVGMTAIMAVCVGAVGLMLQIDSHKGSDLCA